MYGPLLSFQHSFPTESLSSFYQFSIFLSKNSVGLVVHSVGKWILLKLSLNWILLYLSALGIDLVFSSDDECKVKNKKILVKNTTQLIYCQNIILCSPREFHSVCKPVGIREDFLSTKKKKTNFLVLCGWQWSIYLERNSQKDI